MQAQTDAAVQNAHGGMITDQVLQQLYSEAKGAAEGVPLTDTGASLMLLCLPGIIKELKQRRAAMDLIGRAVDLDNIGFEEITTGSGS